jgi:hypothetical protein
MSTPANPPQHSAESQIKQRLRMPRGPDQQDIPEFLQRRADELANMPRAYPPHETVVPVLDDQPVEDEAPGLSPYELDELEREITRAQARPLRRSLSPDYMPPPPLRSQAKVAGDGMTGLVLRLGLVTGAILFAVMLLMGKIPLPASWKSAAAAPWQHLASLVRPAPAPAPAPTPTVAKPVAPPPVQAALPRLVVEGADAGNSDEIGIGVKISGRIEGVMAIVSGLVAGTKLSHGQPWTDSEWLVPAAQLADTKLRPPANFSGTMQYTVALKMPDAKIADRQTLRLQWSAPKRETETRKLDPDEIATMLKRGEELFENGDISSARLLLQRAAEGGSEQAAMALAASFDPGVMKNLGVRGVEADVEKARHWYEMARQYGSKEAPKRLESLASQSR